MAKETTAKARQVRVTLNKSLIGRAEKQRKIVHALGLYKTNDSILKYETTTVAGMLRKVPHLITVEAV